MTFLLFLFGIFLALGMFLLTADLLRLPRLATQRAMLSVGRQEKKQARSVEALLMGWAIKLAPHIHMDEYIPKDVITAIRWLTAAAKQENGYAEYALALVYLTGEDAPKDSVKALSLLKRSAGRGNQFAQYRLGKLLLQGEDAPKDVKAAIRWLTAAAEQGNQYAQYALGKLYLLGKEVPKDRSSAIKWFQLAADQGNEYAQYFLKHMDDRLGQPPVAAVISLFHHLANIFQEQNQPPPSGGVRVAVDRKLLRKIKAKKIAQGHKADDHEPEMQL